MHVSFSSFFMRPALLVALLLDSYFCLFVVVVVFFLAILQMFSAISFPINSLFNFVNSSSLSFHCFCLVQLCLILLSCPFNLILPNLPDFATLRYFRHAQFFTVFADNLKAFGRT